MREAIIKTTVYTFDELNKSAQQVALDKFRDYNTCLGDWDDGVIDIWKAKLESLGFMGPSIYYSGFCSKGDGACFEVDSIDIERLFLQYAQSVVETAEWMQERHGDSWEAWLDSAHDAVLRHFDMICNILYNEMSMSIERNSYGNHYSHANTRYVDCSINLDPDRHEILDLVVSSFHEWAESFREGLSNNIYRDLEAEYEALTSDEAVIEVIKDNGTEFTVDGHEYEGD